MSDWSDDALARCGYFDISRNMEMGNAVAALGALAQPTRLAVFRLLIRAGPGGLSMGAIARQVEVPGATLNHHVAHLKRGGLVRADRAGRNIHVTACFRTMEQLLGYLSEHCCEGVATTTLDEEGDRSQ